MVIPIVISGGSGTRLWPLSRELYPKQFHVLVGRTSMLQETVSRVQEAKNIGPPIVVCNKEHRFFVAEQLREIKATAAGIFLEPEGRNTAPAIAIGALAALAEYEDPVLLVLPADHIIGDRASFYQAVQVGRGTAREDFLVSFGIPPRSPEIGYGYIRRGPVLAMEACAAVSDGQDEDPSILHAYQVDSFVEKPDLEAAKRYLSSGEYFWNSGMFMFRAVVYLRALERHEPEMVACCRRAFAEVRKDLDFSRIGDSFSECKSDSIDYAVMEKCERAAVIPLDAGWSDVGSWGALWEAGTRDRQGNVTVGDVMTAEVTDSYLLSQGRLIAAIGLNGHIVVETDDAVLVASMDRVQEVKEIVNKLRNLDRDEGVLHRKVARPWGSYQGVDRGERFQVKRLIINPGAKLSLQLHRQRAEHWVVVRGTALVTVGDKNFTLREDESTYIPIGAKHQLENIGDEALQIIEVQSGSYLGEDDIVRFEDQYGRV